MFMVVDLGAYGESFVRDPHTVYAELRSRSSVHRVRLPAPDETMEAWLVLGHEEARSALADPRLVKSLAGQTLIEEEFIGRHLLIADAPEHTRLRGLVAREFTSRRVEALAPRIEEITRELLDEMHPLGEADLVAALAFPLPMSVICELLGVPGIDQETFRALSQEVVAPSTVESEESAYRELGLFLDHLIEDKRKQTAEADDLLGALIRATTDDGDRLSPDELRATAFLLLIAGHETTVSLIASAVHCLLAHPRQLADLRADFDGLIDGAVEETLRYESAVQNATYRFASEPLIIGSELIDPGDLVLVSLASGNRDPERFPEPDRYDIHRTAQGHLGFGHGVHYCLGAPLARAEARIALRQLLERCPGLRPDGEAGPWSPGMLIRGPRRVPVRWS